MRLALYQGPGVVGATAENIEIIREAAAEAAAAGAGLIVFPELFLTGYNLPGELRELAETASGPAAKRIADICRNYAIAILYGYPEAAEGLFWNSAQLFDRKGASRGNYRKVHLAPGFERDLFAAGDSFTAMTLGDLTIGALICYDVEFPEAARAVALRGVDVIAVLSATSDGYPEVSRIMVPARAAENQLFVAFANRGGREGTLVYGGGSCIVGPPRARFLSLEGVQEVGQSEEHLILETAQSNELSVGDLLYAIPRHICPTVALHQQATVIEDGNIVDSWKVTARDRILSV